MSKRTLGSLIVRLAVELDQYKADWRQAEDATRQGAARVDQANQGATKSTGALTDALRQQTGAYGQAAEGAADLARSTGLLNAAGVVALGTLAAMAAGIGAVGYAAYQGYKENQKLADGLLLTGNYAGLIAGQLDNMANRVATSIKGTVGASRQVLAQLAGTGRFTVQTLEETATAVQLVAHFSNRATDDVVKDFASMGDGVGKWAEKANSSYHFLDSATLAYITRLEDQGLKQEAVRVTSLALSQHLGGDLTRNLGIVERAWNSITNAASAAWAAMKKVGKPETTDEILAGSSEYLQGASKGLLARSAGGQAQLEQLRAQNFELQRRSEREQRSASDRSAAAQATEKAIAADKEWAKVLSNLADKQQRMNAELATARKAAADRNVGAKELAEVEAKIREKYATKGPKLESTPAYREASRVAEERQKLRIKEDAEIDKFFQTEEQRSKQAADKLIADTQRRSAEYVRGIDQQASAARKAVEAAEWEAASHGKTKSQVAELTLARLEDTRVQMLHTALTEKDLEAINAQIEAQKRLIDVYRQGEVREEGERAAKATAEAWQRTGTFIKDTLLDSVQRGFEAGEKFSRGFFRSLVATAKTTVLRFGVDVVGNGFGFGAPSAGVGGSAGGVMNLASSAGTLSSLVSGGSSILGLFGTAGNAALGTSLGLGAGSSAAAASAAAVAGGASAGSAGALASFGSTAMTAIPYVGAALMVASALGLFDKKGGPKVEGGYNVAGMERGDVSGAKALADDYNSTFAALAGSFGLKNTSLGAGVFFGKDPEGDSLTQYEVQAAGYSRNERLGGFENVGRSDGELAAAVAEEKVRAMWQGLKVRAEQLTPALRALLDAAGNTQDVAVMQQTMDAMQQRAALEEQLWELQATEGEKLARVRERDLAAVAEGNREVVKRIHALQDETAASVAAREAADKVTQATDAAMGALQKAVDVNRRQAQAQLSVAQEAVNTLGTLFATLKGNVNELYGEVLSTQAAAARRGREFIDQALATARSTGYLPDETALADAISAARGGMQQDDYASAFEFDRDRLVLAGKLAELQQISGTQLTAAERQLNAAEEEMKRLDGILDKAQEQVDAIRGGTLTIEAALAQLSAAILGEKAVTGGGSAGQATAGPNAGQQFMSAVEAYGAKNGSDAYYLVDGVNDYDAKKASVEQLARITGQSLDQAWRATSGHSEAYWQEVQRRWEAGETPTVGNMPQLAVGTNRVPQNMIAMIHKDEAVVPAAFNPWAGGRGLGGGFGESTSFDRLEEIMARVAGAVSETADILTGRRYSVVPLNVEMA